MTHFHSASLDKTAGAERRGHAARPPDRFSLLRLSAADRIIGATVVVALLWAGVYWALH